ncbi:baseplate J/gp47 family protein [Saccharibacillus sp. CPCC 101409]|uniref:baseplate J/gp47 family protein n=1 Tax=Saccharibacillus sp. CPCC 101409 TaxID=3058041 RepID=UPI002672139C|nr:baseplate J/gp47 family protein [Saccharibacillus sp. CPCC 101409]MDO3408556.1 baseplate J/gp47 family protein [Saccharibacillus sp. CPCC 101409]
MAEFPYYLQEQTEEAIMQRMLNRLPADLDKSEGSFLWDAQAPAAFMLSEAALWAQELLRRGFASTVASTDANFRSEELDLRAAEHGVTRRAATPAEGTVAFTGEPGRTVPVGTTVASPSDESSGEASKEYETTAAVTLDESGRASAPIRAIAAGSAGNVPPGSIALLSDPVTGVTGVINAASVVGGSDIESDASLLERFYAKVRNQGTSGNKAQYMQWAGEIPGVGASRVIPLWTGPGTVGIYLLDNDKRAASGSIVTAVQTYIDPTQDGQGEGAAPAGPVVTVMPAEEVPIDIEVTPTLASGASAADVKAQIEEGVTAYLKQLAFQDPLVRYTRIAAILLDIPPLIDYTDLTVNGTGDRNLEMEEHQVAVLGTVTVHE